MNNFLEIATIAPAFDVTGSGNVEIVELDFHCKGKNDSKLLKLTATQYDTYRGRHGCVPPHSPASGAHFLNERRLVS